MDIPKILSTMTLREKIEYCCGADMWHTRQLPQHQIPAIKMSDGPHGLRCQADGGDMLGINESLPATCFPAAVTAGATWDRELYAAEGAAIGAEALQSGVSLVLGPGCNIKRNPLGGRNFEYLSEDPHHAGMMTAAFVSGLQSTGASACVKHFAVNSQEFKRQNGDSRLSMRALREIYLRPFQLAVEHSKPATVMCSYNKINGVYASDNELLLTQILRREWGFDGMVVTDWGAMNDRVAAYRAGCDLNMPGGSTYMQKAVEKALAEGTLCMEDIDRSVERILRLTQRALDAPKVNADLQAHHELARKIAVRGAVLLKNDGILPLQSPHGLLVGHMAGSLRYQGSGSSHINPHKLEQLTQALPQMTYFACCDASGAVTREALQEAARLAAAQSVAVVVAGLPDSFESEGFDRDHMALPQGHEQMIRAVAAANPNTVVVLLGGSPMELPWKDEVRAILYMGLPGQAGGSAIADLLLGRENPSGKLTETWPASYSQVICRDTFGVRDPEYREDVYVGYRYYAGANVPVAYPFGFGLSYTRFTYSDFALQPDAVRVTVENTGSCAGEEVVQLYIAPPRDGLHRPCLELKDFAKVCLQPGEKKTVRFPLSREQFALWNDGWVVPGGSYGICIGASSADIRCRGQLEVEGQTCPAPSWQEGSWYTHLQGIPTREEWLHTMPVRPPQSVVPTKGSYDRNSTLREMQTTSRLMRLIYRTMCRIISKPYPKKEEDPACRMMITCATDCPIRSLVINGQGYFTDGMADFFLRIANGRKRRK